MPVVQVLLVVLGQTLHRWDFLCFYEKEKERQANEKLRCCAAV